MKEPSEIRKKARDLRFRYLQRYLEDHLEVRPSNCIYNELHTYESGESLQLCMLGADDPENWPGNICDTVENAKTCPFFATDFDKETLKAEFKAMLEDPDILYSNYRDLAMLEWALEEEAPDFAWWQKFKVWLIGE